VTLGFHAPLPPARSGVADYAAQLIEALRPYAAVAANPLRTTGIDLYHLGNNQLHGEIYRRALKRPGVVVLHDAVLQHFLLGWLDESLYVEEFVYNYGEWSRELARQLWRCRARSAQDPRYFEYPMLRRIAEVSKAVIVHNPGAAAIVKSHAPSAPVVEIPHFWRAPELPPSYEITRLRESLGLRPSTFLFGVFGHLRESKRLLSVLRAFRVVRGSALLIAGEFTSSDLARALAPLLGAPGVVRAGYLPERDFWLHAAAADACVNLRYPAAGETSAIAIRMMGMGKPVILTAGQESSRFPATACLRVDAGPAETEMLAAYMTWLAEFRAAAGEIGRRGAEYVRREHALEECARRYAVALGLAS